MPRESHPAEAGYVLVAPWSVLQAGGVAHAIRNIGRELAGLGAWRVCFLESADRRARLETPEGLPIFMERMRRRPPPGASLRERATFGLTLLPLAARTLWFLRRQRVEVVNIHYPTPESWLFGALRRWRLYRGRLIISVHGADVNDPSEIERTWLQPLLKSADAVIACSQALAQRVDELHIAGAAPVLAIHNGFTAPTGGTESFWPDGDGARRALRLIAVAAYEHKKGLDTLLGAFALCRRSHPGLELEIVGGYTPYYETIKTLTRSLKLDDAVRLRVNVPHPDTLRAIAAAAALVLPSRREPFGLVLLEAGYLGTPIIATKVGGIPEVIASNEYGLLVPPDDADALADAILNVLRDPTAARARAEAMRARVRSDFSWRATAERYGRLARGGNTSLPSD